MPVSVHEALEQRPHVWLPWPCPGNGDRPTTSPDVRCVIVARGRAGSHGAGVVPCVSIPKPWDIVRLGDVGGVDRLDRFVEPVAGPCPLNVGFKGLAVVALHSPWGRTIIGPESRVKPRSARPV